MANQEFSSRILKTNIPYVALLGWIPFRFCLIPLDGAICLFLLTNETVPCISSTLKRNYIVIVGLFFVEKIVSEFSVKIGLSLN